ncbi:MAG: LPS export ABC transporter permease LptG [Haemophilus parainfluenzae]|nr:LPS export ABC transporter permease LptG [Haemophilus parainfluenzae]
MMNTLDRYIGKSILGAIFATLFTLVGLSAIIKFVEQFRSVGKGSYDIWQAVAYTGLTMPKDVETFFPMAALLGALIALGNLASRSELVVMQSLPLVLFTMIIGEWGIPQTEQFARDMRTRALSGGSMLSVKNGVWAKDGNNFVYVRRIKDDAKLEDIYIYTFDDQRNLTHLKHANQAQYSAENNQWQLRQVNNSAVSKEQITTTNRLTEDWATSLTPDKLGGSLRSITAGARIVTGICFGFLFYVVNEIFGQMSVVFNAPAFLGALMPSLLFMAIIWWLLARKRD